METTWPGRGRWRRDWRKWRWRCLSYAFRTAQLCSWFYPYEIRISVVQCLPDEAAVRCLRWRLSLQNSLLYWDFYVTSFFHGHALLYSLMTSSFALWSLPFVNWCFIWEQDHIIGCPCTRNWRKAGLAVALSSEDVFILSAQALLGYWVLVVQQICVRTSYYLRV